MKGLIRALSKALNVAESELSSTLLDGEKEKDGAEQYLNDKLAARVKELNDAAEEKRKTDVQNTEGRVRKETAEKFEKQLITAIPGLDSALKGDDLLKTIPDAIAKIRTAEDEPTKIRTSKVYQDDLKAQAEKLKGEYEGEIAKKETALTELQKANQQKEVKATVTKLINDEIGKLKMRTDVDKEVINALISAAQQTVLSNHFKISEKGELDVLDDKGQLATDAHGHFVKAIDVITKAIEPVKKLSVAGEPRKDGPNPGNDPKDGTASLESLGLTLPKNIDEFSGLIASVNKLVAEKKLTSEGSQKLIQETQKAMLEASGEAK